MLAHGRTRPLALAGGFLAAAILGACSTGRDPIAPPAGPSLPNVPSMLVGVDADVDWPTAPPSKSCDLALNRPDLAISSIAKTSSETQDPFGNISVRVSVTIRNQGLCKSGPFPVEVRITANGVGKFVRLTMDETAATGTDGWTKVGLAPGASMTVGGIVTVMSDFIGGDDRALLFFYVDACRTVPTLSMPTCAVPEPVGAEGGTFPNAVVVDNLD